MVLETWSWRDEGFLRVDEPFVVEQAECVGDDEAAARPPEEDGGVSLESSLKTERISVIEGTSSSTDGVSLVPEVLCCLNRSASMFLASCSTKTSVFPCVLLDGGSLLVGLRLSKVLQDLYRPSIFHG
jgi:hypothetical protein